uniref:U2 snRNP auxiliary factor small subunit family protein n=1 Tax=Populus alba TaxID=43335 RepID=A0A4U5Q4Q1_POPAL|nr:U2 snRNP auxiliary factor small subunit family protein [Populus alba]
MAEHLASIFGTEKDRVNCPFYFKIGACRHGDRCSRLHNRPTISPTLLLSNTYHRPDMITPGVDAQGQPLDPHKIQEHFEDFYEDIFEELSKFGEIENLNVCDNLADHMIGNVYVQFKEEDQAAAALQSLQGRFYSGRPIIADFSPVTDFREATCRQYEENNCNRGGLVGVGVGVRVRGGGIEIMIGVRGIPETETVIIVEMGGGMTETEGGKDTGVRGGAGARSGKAARKEGPGLSSGIGRGRRSSDLKREKVVLAGLGVEMYVGIFLLLQLVGECRDCSCQQIHHIGRVTWAQKLCSARVRVSSGSLNWAS